MTKHDTAMDHHACLIRTSSYADYSHLETTVSIFVDAEKFGVADARLLTTQAQLRPATSAGQVFVVRTGFITHEAQNALLKLFEEPPVDTSFVLVVPPSLQLLPTLLSRIGSEKTVQDVADTTVWDAFISVSPAERLKQIDVWHKTKDQIWLQAMTVGVHSLQAVGYTAAALEVVQLVGSKLQTRGASNKMLLEHLALTLPFQK
jgi:hypothetical protein